MRLIDRIARAAVGMGLGRRSTALIETIGRTSGIPRVTPVTNGLDGDVFWIVTEHGQRANYVRNIEAERRVRVNAGGSWRSGVAQIVNEDPEERLQQIVALNRRTRSNAKIVRRMAPNISLSVLTWCPSGEDGASRPATGSGSHCERDGNRLKQSQRVFADQKEGAQVLAAGERLRLSGQPVATSPLERLQTNARSRRVAAHTVRRQLWATRGSVPMIGAGGPRALLYASCVKRCSAKI
jgi:deazaflavin-dependent oxidoreductase (nitroreductase family)